MQQGNEFYFQDKDFDAKKYVDSIWDSKVIPNSNEKAVDIGELIKEVKSDVNGAGKKFGICSGAEGTLWNFIVKGRGTVLSVNKESRVGTVEIELAPYDSKANIKLQIGPVIKGTAVRDSLGFIKYDDFKNQMVFAEVSNAFHQKITDTLLSKTDFEALRGKEINFIGAFTFVSTNEIVVTPIKLEIVKGGK